MWLRQRGDFSFSSMPPRGVGGYIVSDSILIANKSQYPAALYMYANLRVRVLQECWTVEFGNIFEGGGRHLLAGYSSGSIRLFDLTAGTERWSKSLGGGVTCAAFDRPNIEMNKFSAVCMDSIMHTFDARTLHSENVSLFSDICPVDWQGSSIQDEAQTFCFHFGL